VGLRRTVAGIQRHRKVQIRLLGTLVLLLAAVRSAAASNCALPAKDADTVHVNARSNTLRRGTSSNVLFGVQKWNAVPPTVLELELELVLVLVLVCNLRKQAWAMLSWNRAQFVWSCLLILFLRACNFNIHFVDFVSTRWWSVDVPLRMYALCVVAHFNQQKSCGLNTASFIDKERCSKKETLRPLLMASNPIYCSVSVKLTISMHGHITILLSCMRKVLV
jgi:hypothetical protein